MRRHARDNGLTLFFLGLFLIALVGQALVGHAAFNDEQAAHSDPAISLGRYVTSSVFLVDVMENWQSEYLQFTLFILVTVWLVQRGSPESKAPGQEGAGSDDQPPGLRGALYANSLVLLMATFFVLTWLGQLVTGRIQYNAEQLDHQEAGLTLWQYAGTADFWNRTLQNWQSEFLAVASMVIFSVYLRQRGSPESKPVGAPIDSTASY